jgi:hypothetical protein
MLKHSARNEVPRRSRRELNHEIRLQVSPEESPLGLFRVPNDGIISADRLGSDMLPRRYPRGTGGRPVSVWPKKLARTLIRNLGILGLNLAAQGCYSQKSQRRPIHRVHQDSSAGRGGRERVCTISGRVRNAQPRQQIAIYAHSGPWWVQPWPR